MQKSLAFILLLLHLYANTELQQIFRLPRLISHYFQHHRQDTSISFSKFLGMHYGGNDGTTSDDDIDKKLPFHNPVLPCLSVVYFPLVQDPIVINPPVISNIQYNGYSQPFISSGYFSKLLRPPQFS